MNCKDCGSDSAPSYCGYPEGVTGFRLAVAIITVILAVLLFFKVWDNVPRAGYVILLINAIFWFAAVVVDATILSNSTLACTNSDFLGNGSEFPCDNATYGQGLACFICCLTILIDFHQVSPLLLTFALLLLHS